LKGNQAKGDLSVLGSEKRTGLLGWLIGAAVLLFGMSGVSADEKQISDPQTSVQPRRDGTDYDNLPVEVAIVTAAPNCPPPILRKHPARVIVDLNTNVQELPVDTMGNTYEFWTFNGTVPGPMMRARVGDMLEIHLRNDDPTGMQHNIDLHCVTGPGGGASLLTADKDETKCASFKLLYPGLYIYHCAVYPVPMHVANGMYGLILVEPERGLPPVDKEFYVVQSEIYAAADEEKKDTIKSYFSHHWTPQENVFVKKSPLGLSYDDLMNEKPRFVVLNGREGALTDTPLEAETTDKIRIFFGNAGPNLMSSLHVIGTVLDKVYREGDMMSPPANGIHVTQVPSGGSTVVEFIVPVPGTYTILDHALSRMEKGCVGFINVKGEKCPGIYHSDEPAKPCASCKIHP